jgi:hypothetical protein
LQDWHSQANQLRRREEINLHDLPQNGFPRSREVTETADAGIVDKYIQTIETFDDGL